MADAAAAIAQPQAYTADGQPIAPEDYSAAAKAGQAFFPKGSRVFVRNSAGALQSVDAGDVAHEGLTVLHPEEVQAISDKRQYGKGLGNVARATAEGAARGVTLGGSDALIAGVGGEEARKGLAGRKAANPIAAGVGEVAGAIAPLALTGGAAAPEEAAALGLGEAAEGASALSTAGSAASGAVRALGAGHRVIAGVGSLVERGVARGLEALGADGATAAGRIGAAGVKLAARGATEGALYGGAQAANDAVLNGDDITAEKIVAGMGHGALFGGVAGGLLGVGGQALGEGAAALIPKKAALQQLAREQGLKGAGFKGSDFRRLAGRATGEAADSRIAATADDLMNTTLETGPLKGERVLQPGANVEETLARVSAAKEEAVARLSGLKDELSDRMSSTGASPDPAEFLRRADEQVFKPALKSDVPGVRSEVRAAERELSIMRERVAAAAESSNPEQAVYSFRDLDQFRQDLASRVYPKAPPGGGIPAPPPKGAAQLMKVERVLSDYLKEQASTFLAKAGEDPNAYNEANRLYNSFNKLEQVGTKTANQSLGNRSISPSDHALGMSSALGALATGNVGALGAMGYGAAATFANKMLRERGNSVVADLARRAASMDSSIDTVAQVLAGKTAKVKAPVLAATFEGENLRETYDRTASRVRELAVPQTAQAHISGLIPTVTAQYPQVGASVSTKLLQIYQQLQAKLPASHTDLGTTLTPLAVKERVPPLAMRSFLSSVRGALEPEKVITELGHGVIDREAIASLKDAHPKTFLQLRQKVADFVQQRQDELPYKRRMMLSMTFGFVGDSSLEPQRMAGLQEAAQALSFQEAAQDAQAIKPKAGNPGVSKLGKSLTPPMDAAFAGET